MLLGKITTFAKVFSEVVELAVTGLVEVEEFVVPFEKRRMRGVVLVVRKVKYQAFLSSQNGFFVTRQQMRDTTAFDVLGQRL